MSRFWFTQHWPHPREAAQDFPWFVYLQHEYRRLGEPLQPGHRVAFYETLGSRTHLNERGHPVPLQAGRGAVVMTATVSGTIRTRAAPDNVRQYEEGGTLNWAWEVPCNDHRTGTPVALPELRRILNRGGFLIKGGIIEITRYQFEQIEAALIGG